MYSYVNIKVYVWLWWCVFVTIGMILMYPNGSKLANALDEPYRV